MVFLHSQQLRRHTSTATTNQNNRTHKQEIEAEVDRKVFRHRSHSITQRTSTTRSSECTCVPQLFNGSQFRVSFPGKFFTEVCCSSRTAAAQERHQFRQSMQQVGIKAKQQAQNTQLYQETTKRANCKTTLRQTKQITT